MKVLLTGSTGYVGGRLREKLIDDPGISLRLFVRSRKKVPASYAARAEISEGDSLKYDSLIEALRGIDTAVYLLHSMGEKGGSYEELDRKSAENFREACIASGVKKIIYLGGLGKAGDSSRHLQSRIETGMILSAKPDKIRTVWFRAAVIIGSGGASYEIIRHLVEKLPLMIAPAWLSTKTQPIGINEVVSYLHRAVHMDFPEDSVIDIGGGILTFKDMLLEAARVLGLKRKIFTVPFFSPRLSSYWLIFITPVPFSVASALVDGLRHETVVENDLARKLFPDIVPQTYEESFRLASLEEEEDRIISRWCDSSQSAYCDITSPEDISSAIFTEKRTADTRGIPEADLFPVVTSIGGKNGWFSFSFLWKLRGLIDKFSGGAGLNRGRRSVSSLRVGDSIDFWKVVDLAEGRRLLLLAQMRLPGRAWLEFVVSPGRIGLNAYFIPRGLAGRLYWYASYPFHILIFSSMMRSIIKQAKARARINSGKENTL